MKVETSVKCKLLEGRADNFCTEDIIVSMLKCYIKKKPKPNKQTKEKRTPNPKKKQGASRRIVIQNDHQKMTFDTKDHKSVENGC